MDDDNKIAESDIDDLNLTNSRLSLSAPKRFGKQKGSGIAFPFPISATDFLVKVNTLLETEEERAKLFDALRNYHELRKIKRLVRDLKLVLDNSKKYPLFREVRALIPQEHLFAYDKLTEGARSGERIVRIKRHANEPLGLKFKGGKEHEVGIYVTSIIPGSAAHASGLKIGDEILKVNGLTLQESIHDEVVNLLKNKASITLVTRNMGKIPNKVKCEGLESSSTARAREGCAKFKGFHVSKNNMITWTEVDPNTRIGPPDLWDSTLAHMAADGEVRKAVREDDRLLAFKIGKEGLGCSIRSGVAGHEGIFVSAVSQNSLADQIGLKIGDRILDVNGKSFEKIKHSEAVDALKSRKDLIMMVRHNQEVENYFRGKKETRQALHPILRLEPTTQTIVKSARFEQNPVVDVIEGPLISDDEDEDNNEDVEASPANLEYDPDLLQGREVHFVSVPKSSTLMMDLEVTNGILSVKNIGKGGAVSDHGFIKRGDWILNVEGTELTGLPLQEANDIVEAAMSRLARCLDLIVACPPGRRPPMMPDKRILSSTMEDTNIVTASPTRRLSAANLDDPKLKGVLKTIALFELSSTPTKKPPLQRKDSLEQARNSLRLYKEKKRTEVKKDWESPMGSPSRYDNHMDVLDNWNETEWLQKGYSGEIHQQSVTDCSPRRQTSSAAGQHGEFVSRASQHRVVAQVHSPPVERSPQRSVSTNVSRYQEPKAIQDDYEKSFDDILHNLDRTTESLNIQTHQIGKSGNQERRSRKRSVGFADTTSPFTSQSSAHRSLEDISASNSGSNVFEDEQWEERPKSLDLSSTSDIRSFSPKKTLEGPLTEQPVKDGIVEEKRRGLFGLRKSALKNSGNKSSKDSKRKKKSSISNVPSAPPPPPAPPAPPPPPPLPSVESQKVQPPPLPPPLPSVASQLKSPPAFIPPPPIPSPATYEEQSSNPKVSFLPAQQASSTQNVHIPPPDYGIESSDLQTQVSVMARNLTPVPESPMKNPSPLKKAPKAEGKKKNGLLLSNNLLANARQRLRNVSKKRSSMTKSETGASSASLETSLENSGQEVQKTSRQHSQNDLEQISGMDAPNPLPQFADDNVRSHLADYAGNETKLQSNPVGHIKKLQKVQFKTPDDSDGEMDRSPSFDNVVLPGDTQDNTSKRQSLPVLNEVLTELKDKVNSREDVHPRVAFSPGDQNFHQKNTVLSSSSPDILLTSRSRSQSTEEEQRETRIQRRQVRVVTDIDENRLANSSVGIPSGPTTPRTPRTQKNGDVLDMEGAFKELDDVIRSLDAD